MAVSRGASEPADVAGVVAAEPAGVAVGPSATSIGSAADDCPPTTHGGVASAVFMLLARSPSSRVCSWGIGSYAWTLLLVSISGMAFLRRDGRLRVRVIKMLNTRM